MGSIALFREDLVASRILCCRVAERLLHFSFSINEKYLSEEKHFNLKIFQKNYLERVFLKCSILSL